MESKTPKARSTQLKLHMQCGLLMGFLHYSYWPTTPHTLRFHHIEKDRDGIHSLHILQRSSVNPKSQDNRTRLLHQQTFFAHDAIEKKVSNPSRLKFEALYIFAFKTSS